MNCSDSNTFDKKYREETCYKCKRNCKSRAALFLNGYWIHYISDKLSEEDINNIEHKDTPYKCKSCKPCKAIQIKSPSDTFQSGNMPIDQNYEVSDKNIPAMTHIKLIDVDRTTYYIMGDNFDKPTGAESLLIEECNYCCACRAVLDSNINTCCLCAMLFHYHCIDMSTNTCYG
jgi:hypothetical protein